jgi:hypothetical protein
MRRLFSCFFLLARSWQKGIVTFVTRVDNEFHRTMHAAVVRSAVTGMV